MVAAINQPTGSAILNVDPTARDAVHGVSTGLNIVATGLSFVPPLAIGASLVSKSISLVSSGFEGLTTKFTKGNEEKAILPMLQVAALIVSIIGVAIGSIPTIAAGLVVDAGIKVATAVVDIIKNQRLDRAIMKIALAVITCLGAAAMLAGSWQLCVATGALLAVYGLANLSISAALSTENQCGTSPEKIIASIASSIATILFGITTSITAVRSEWDQVDRTHYQYTNRSSREERVVELEKYRVKVRNGYTVSKYEGTETVVIRRKDLPSWDARRSSNKNDLEQVVGYSTRPVYSRCHIPPRYETRTREVTLAELLPGRSWQNSWGGHGPSDLRVTCLNPGSPGRQLSPAFRDISHHISHPVKPEHFAKLGIFEVADKACIT